MDNDPLAAAVELTAPAGLRTRSYEEADLQALLDLFTQTFDGWPKHELDVPPIDHLRWKLSSVAARPDAQPAIAEIDGRLIGAVCGILHQAQVEGTVRTAYLGIESCVLPEFQASGVMKAIRRYRGEITRNLQAFDLFFGIESNHPALAKVRGVGAGGERYVHPVDVLSARVRDPGPPPHRLPVRVVERFDERVDGLWSRASEPFRFTIARSAAYLNWRYDRRAGMFTILLAEERGDLAGYAVYRESYGKAYIVDLLALPEREDVLSALVLEIFRRLHADSIATVACWSPREHRYRPALRRLGFRLRRRVVYAIFRRLAMPGADFAFLREEKPPIHIMAGDTDLV